MGHRCGAQCPHDSSDGRCAMILEENYPKYDANEPCPKCGWLSMQPSYSAATMGLIGPLSERIYVTCRCGYVMVRACLDATTKPALSDSRP